MIDNMIRSYCLLAAHISVLCVMSSPVVNFTCDKQREAAISPGSVLDVVCIQPHVPEASKKCIVGQKRYGRRPRGLSNRNDNSDTPDWSRQRCVTLEILPERATRMHKSMVAVHTRWLCTVCTARRNPRYRQPVAFRRTQEERILYSKSCLQLY